MLFTQLASGWLEWLQPTGEVLLACLLLLLCTIAWLTNLIALPGNWISVLLIAVYAWAGPQDGRVSIGYGTVLACFVFALIGEIVEFVAGAYGAKSAGASKKSTLYSIIGSVIGALVGAAVGIPVPVVGPVLAALLFGGLGASAGAMYGEWSDGRRWRDNWSVGTATFVGRTIGTLGKFGAGLLMLLVAVAAVLL
ncbi:DUF456 domain-containing protein [Stieleria varia]|uniref:DUF456 domain-containing protein n=1 Tax=Stieleria varia TaxID=2528005 RepID=A0A5C6AN74_9BACT|nr:DUF456 domain-containing protein [Stieleria varia]TWU00937.1 hypothetical protein Pla52n_43070 [Stieleria varia]